MSGARQQQVRQPGEMGTPLLALSSPLKLANATEAQQFSFAPSPVCLKPQPLLVRCINCTISLY